MFLSDCKNTSNSPYKVLVKLPLVLVGKENSENSQ